MKKMILSALSMLSIISSASAGTDYYYTPQPVGTIAGRALVGVNIEKNMFFGLSGVEDVLPIGSITQAITNWNVGNFSGSNTPTPLSNYQRGIAGYGSTSVAMFDQVQSNGSVEPIFSSMLNAWDYPYNTQHPLSGSYLSYWFHENGQDMNHRPFKNGPTSTLYYSSMIQVPTAYVESGGQSQLAMGLTLVDETTKQYYWLMPAVFNTNSTYITHEGIDLDPGTNAYMVGTYIGNGSSYLTPSNGSHSATNNTWTGWRWYGYSISYSQMQLAINNLNKKLAEKCPKCTLFSTDPANYHIGMMFTGAEVTRPIADNPGRRAHIGFSSYGHWLYSTY